MALPHVRSEDIQCCFVIHKRSHSCPLQAGTTTLYESLGFDDFRFLCTSYPSIHRPHFAEYEIRDIYFARTDVASNTASSSSLRHQPCRVYEDDWDYLNEFPRLSVQSEVSETHLGQILPQTGDNTSENRGDYSHEANSITALHDPSQELTLFNRIRQTASSDEYLTADNDHTSSFTSVNSPTTGQLSRSISTLRPCETYSQADNSYCLDSHYVDNLPPSIWIHRPANSSTAVSISPVYETYLLYNCEQTDIVGLRSPPNSTPSKVLTRLPVQIELKVYYVTEEWLFLLAGDQAKGIYPDTWYSRTTLLKCKQPVFTFHNIRQLSSSTDSSISVSRYSDYVTLNPIDHLLKPIQKLDGWHDSKDSQMSSSESSITRRVSPLFVQNSASDKNMKRLSSGSGPIVIQVLNPVPVDQPSETLPSHPTIPAELTGQNVLPSQVSESVASNEGNKEIVLGSYEGRISTISALSPHLQLMPIEEGNRPSVLSVCGVEMDLEELRSLNDVPPEFTTAEVLFRRAVRSESIRADRLSAQVRNSTLLKQISSVDEVGKHPSAVTTNLHRAEESNVELRIPRVKTSTELEPGQLISPNRPSRSSLIMVYPPHPHPAHTITHQSEDQVSGNELPELNSKITGTSWATIDSTEISRGMHFIHQIETSSCDALDVVSTKGLTKPSALPAKECLLHIAHTKHGGLSLESQHFSRDTREMIGKCGQITPNLHYCALGHVNEEMTHRRTASPDSTRFIGLMRQFANARIRAKSERFVPHNAGHQLSDLYGSYGSITRH
ncbi:hypothetical protein D915_003485 [Fasciola hepatica]|uniref:Uncharacterized protein n=1 Tax=Fasciola hepatica TaxID=6192 RepID=A0A4E0RW06_FASHE|nr:hypothetical protein D915_003485 [Fasciola hepatica]